MSDDSKERERADLEEIASILPQLNLDDELRAQLAKLSVRDQCVALRVSLALDKLITAAHIRHERPTLQ